MALFYMYGFAQLMICSVETTAMNTTDCRCWTVALDRRPPHSLLVSGVGSLHLCTDLLVASAWLPFLAHTAKHHVISALGWSVDA